MRFLTSLLLLFFAGTITAQTNAAKVLAPHDAPAPESKLHISLSPTPRSIAGGPWIVDAHFESILYLKNVVENASITVTPVVYLSNGTKYQLSAVQIAPSGVSKIDIGARRVWESHPWQPSPAGSSFNTTGHGIRSAHS